MNICVYGAASNDIDRSFIEAGEALGLELAKRGHNLVFGGGDNGMMGAVARGAHKGCAHITGVAPSFFNIDGMLYPENDELIYTDTMRQRKQKMEDLSDAFIVTPGGIGTFEEFFEILTLKQIGRSAKPLAIYNINGYYDPMLKMLQNTIDCRFMSEMTMELICVSDKLDEIIKYTETPSTLKADVEKLRHIR